MIFNGGFYSDSLMKGANYCDDGLIAVIHNPAKLRISLRNPKFTYYFYFLAR